MDVVPYKGARVAKASPQDIEDMYTIVGVLEGYVAKSVTPHLETSHMEKLKKLHVQMQDEDLKKDGRTWLKVNNEFHRVFVDLYPLSHLKNLIYEKIGPIGRYWYIGISIPGVMEDGIRGHGGIIEAFENRDSELVRQLVENHRIITGRKIRENIENMESA